MQDDVELDFASMLNLLGNEVTRRVLVALSDTGVREVHGYVFQRVLAGPSTATEMATDFGVSQQAVSKVLRELVGMGYLEVADDPHDRRRHPVRLTAAGRHVVARGRRAREEINQQLASALGEKRLAASRVDLTVALRTLGLTQQIQAAAVAPREGLLE